MRAALFGAVLLGAVTTAAAAAEPVVSVRAQDAPVTLGEPFDLFISVVHPPELEIKVPASVSLGEAFIELERHTARAANPDGTVTTLIELSVLPSDYGELEVPGIPLTYAVGDSAHTLTTPPLPIEVRGVVTEGDEELRPIAGPVPVSYRDWTMAWVGGAIGVGLGVALLAWSLANLVRRRRRVEHAAEAAALVPADREALARLAALEASGALDAGDRRPAYFALSEIVRAYLGRLHGFPALDLTTSEIAHALQRWPEAGPTRDALGDLLERCDLVKFAGWDAEADEAREALYQARRLVEQTRAGAAPPPAPVLPPETGPLAREHERV